MIFKRRKKYRYFISYYTSINNTVNIGTVEVSRDKKIKNLENINEIARAIEEHHDYPRGTVVVNNFKLFED